MTLRQSIITVLALAAALGVIGATIGASIGLLLPDFYRTVFRVPAGADINMVALGTGLGLTQGLTFGIVVGVVIVIVAAWREVRLAQCKSPPP
ncbi:MAG: hypothetical protein JNG89_05260 [Planctomycetaceae bacterium]|nr:hypothetical protein [Planctomycetaceae bacterium]